ncbi:hypothetical protein DF057_29585 [Burkholderia cepacia]|uniref:hypothetical protein n=1 Tax=Burkholderia cepacia TaxID=292 RepID=UPI000F5F0CD5|nr:hypothetical protein [Burkholderia cepacia]RQZ57275.1 hypothetical protein DF057_29585 [Burkholderia cepacia]
MNQLEQYYAGDDVWKEFSDLFAKYKDLPVVRDLAKDLNEQLEPEKFFLYMKIGGMWLTSDACFVQGRKARIDIEPSRLIITQL